MKPKERAVGVVLVSHNHSSLNPLWIRRQGILIRVLEARDRAAEGRLSMYPGTYSTVQIPQVSLRLAYHTCFCKCMMDT